jgi:glucuronate isomerase
MTNKHIELVKRWLACNDSVSPAELADNEEAAWAAYDNAMKAADAAYFAALSARAADEGANSAAVLRVKNYEETTNDK